MQKQNGLLHSSSFYCTGEQWARPHYTWTGPLCYPKIFVVPMSSMSMSLPITLPRHCSNFTFVIGNAKKWFNALIDSVNEMFSLQRCHKGQGLRESAGKSCGIWSLWLKEVKNTWMLGWVLICFIFVFHSFHNPAFPKIKEGVWSITIHQDVISEGANLADASRGLNFQR